VESAVDAQRAHWEQWREIHTGGFTVLAEEDHGIPVDRDSIVQNTRFEPIFNESDVAIGQSSHRMHGRRHKQTGRVLEDVKSFQKNAQDFLDRCGWSLTACSTGKEQRKSARDAYALFAAADCKDAMQFVLAGQRAKFGCTDASCPKRCTRQRFHGDAAPPRAFFDQDAWAQRCRDERNPQRVEEDQPIPPMPAWGDVPLVMLLATQDGTPFHVRPFNGAEKTITLNAGDLVIFRGDLSHAGAAFDEDNYRLHVYIDSPVHPRTKNETFHDPAA